MHSGLRSAVMTMRAIHSSGTNSANRSVMSQTKIFAGPGGFRASIQASSRNTSTADRLGPGQGKPGADPLVYRLGVAQAAFLRGVLAVPADFPGISLARTDRVPRIIGPLDGRAPQRPALRHGYGLLLG